MDKYDDTIDVAIEDDDDDEDDDSNELETTTFDMGNGQSTLIEAPAEGRDQTILVDAGSDTSSGLWEDSYRDDLTSQLPTDTEGNYVIDHLVVSHNHTDHISYVDEILADPQIEVRNLCFSGVRNDNFANGNPIEEADTSNTATEILREGDQITFGEATADVLNPNETANQANAGVDENSIVLHVQHESGEVLTTGDIRESHESYVATEFNSELTSVDILMASHHGTSAPDDTVVSDDILDATTPSHLIISNSNDLAGSRNSRYAPDCAVFNRADERNIATYWTAIHGNIEFSGDIFRRADSNSSVTAANELQSDLPYSC